LPSYRTDAPGQSDLNQAVAAANQAVAGVLASANSDITQMNEDQATAYQDASAALSAGACGPNALPPASLQTLS
jgi:hypothetical protein